MIKKKIKIINKLGLHARASSKLTELANNFKCDIKIKKGSEEADAKNMMDILMLSANYNSKVDIIFSGSDEKKASNEIEKLFLNYFGEDE
ncbi:MAG: HPr family phosphocarrier protein [Methylophilaceae bacterium]|jgi:phosphocarrier protein|nr:HPr family phosphocarrier protein [Methylophilaceae bacterium]MBL6727023.1 HPr family phosphocarrier protein [Methylophilaceae bacterium]MBL6728464.1 HPr family phosphocarrier protein [Methylophilaceae bacterium]MBL6791361.1 HPr family phosphocarrier protein [Methylophilaceae bacterium]